MSKAEINETELEALANFAVVEGVPEPVNPDDAIDTLPTAQVGELPDQEWWTLTDIQKRLSVSYPTLKKYVGSLTTERPEWSQELPNQKNISTEHFHLDLVRAIKQDRDKTPPAPEGWHTVAGIAAELGISYQTASNFLLGGAAENEGQTASFRDGGGQARTFYSPERISKLKEYIASEYATPPEEWVPMSKLADELSVDRSTIINAIRRHGGEDSIRQFKVGNAKKTYCLDPELAELIKADISSRREAPEGWTTATGLARQLGKDWGTVRKLIDRHKEEYPKLSGIFSEKGIIPAEYIAPEMALLITKKLTQYTEPAEGWATQTQAQTTINRPKQTIAKAAEAYRQEHPEWFQQFSKRGKVAEYYAPELLSAIATGFEKRGAQRDGWMASTTFYEAAGRSALIVGRLIAPYRESNPEWFTITNGARGHEVDYLSPELLVAIQPELDKYSEAPEGWQPVSQIAAMTGKSISTVMDRAEKWLEDHPDSISYHLADSAPGRGSGRPVQHYHPDLVATLVSERAGMAPEGWLSLNQIKTLLGRLPGDVIETINALSENNPDLHGLFSSKSNHLIDYYDPQILDVVQEKLNSYALQPEGWIANRSLAKSLNRAQVTVQEFADNFRKTNPEWFSEFRGSNGKVYEYYSPELKTAIESLLGVHDGSAYQRKIEQEKLRVEVAEFLTDIGEGESIEAQEFQNLVGLFGAGQVVDILYHYRPEYRKMAVPDVKSALADYLGDFMSLRGEFTLEGLENGIGTLRSSSFKESLTEIIKADVLRLLNQVGQLDSADVNPQTVMDYLTHIRAQSADFTNSDLEEVLGEVEAYYQLLFENIHKPTRFVDELGEGRLFPDINQRINVQEIAFKHRMLIADEMGMGKSASAIMAKEILGVSQALVVVPSNVVEVWQDYLSDKVGEDGKQIGYFKPGQMPSVMIVDSMESLEGIHEGEYDYVIISQERLNESYTEALKSLNYDMLIVDEVHKLKNIAYGKRSECLVELAEVVATDDKYLTLLSGTPVPNKISDVALTLRLLHPDKFEGVDNKQLVNQIINGDMLDLRSLLVPRMQMKSLAESVAMPAISEEIIRFELSPEEQELYSILIEEDELTANEKLKILRQFVLNPQLLDATPDISGSKQEVVSAALRETFSERDKVVMFVNGYVEGVMRGDNAILSQLDIPDDVEVLAIDGSVSKPERLLIQEQLRRSGQKMLLVVSGQTADVGVDFSAAEAVYFYNEPWTEYDKRQQKSRVYRPGLQEDLEVRTFIAAGTIEDGMHKYIQTKCEAVEKLLRGIPISDIEKEMLKQGEKQADPNLEVNSELAEYYFSSWDKMMKIYGHVKELGESDFKKFLSRYDVEYAQSYASLVGSRSYQANVARLSGTLLNAFVREKGQNPETIKVLDIASGPEMLRRHIDKDLAKTVISLDINRHHFEKGEGQRVAGSFVSLPVQDNSVDYVNLSLGLHYTSFAPTHNNLERLKVLTELNRALKPGGRGVIDMIYSLDLVNDEHLAGAMDKLGFKVIGDYTGTASHGNNFRSQVITVEKTRDCLQDIKQLAKEIGPQGLKAFKFKRTKASLRDSRRIATAFEIGKKVLDTNFNSGDELALSEEQELLVEMSGLKNQYGQIENIPRELILGKGLARIFNGKRYILFKQLKAGNGAIIVR